MNKELIFSKGIYHEFANADFLCRVKKYFQRSLVTYFEQWDVDKMWSRVREKEESLFFWQDRNFDD